MRELKTLLETKTNTSIKLNGIFYPANSVCEAAINYVAAYFFGNPEFPDFPLSRRGSGFRLFQDNRFYVCSTFHQLGDFSPEWVMIPSLRNNFWTSGNGVTIPSLPNTALQHIDLCLIDYTEPVREGVLSKSSWYNLHREYEWEEILGCLALGYPTEYNNIYKFSEKIELKCAAILGGYLGTTGTDLYGFKPQSTLKYDPDGLSGGIVFFITRNKGIFELVPAGIITNAGRDQINFIHASKIQTLISH